MFAALLLAGCNTLSAPLEPPIVSLTDLRVRDVRLFEQRYVLGLRVQNPTPAALPIQGMAYQVLLNDVELGRGASREAVTLPLYGEALIEVDVVSNVFSLLRRVQDLGRSGAGNLKFSVSGSVSVADRPQPLPFSFHGEIAGSGS